MIATVWLTLPPFTVSVVERSLVLELASTVTMYLYTASEEEDAGATRHQLSSLLLTSNATFDLTDSISLPPVFEKIISDLAGMISGVTGSSSPEQATMKTKSASSRETLIFTIRFFIRSY